jgi:His/Glu/Gln/Arg/opine family amino acid ABC transporter permease subunit
MIPGWMTPDLIELLTRGAIVTIWMTLVTSVLSFVLGVMAVTLRIVNNWLLRNLAGIYIELHRNIPALVLIMFWVFAFPSVFPASVRVEYFFDNPLINYLEQAWNIPIPYYTIAASLAITLNTSAYIAEILRAGIGTISSKHIDTARTIGASKWLIYRSILIPQSIRVAFPAISTRLIHNMKNTALAALVSTPEFFNTTQAVISKTFHAVDLLIIAAIFFLLLSITMSAVLKLIERNFQKPKWSSEKG